jgi:membrane dipeptidase
MGSEVTPPECIVPFESLLRYGFVMLPLLVLIPVAVSARLVRRSKPLGFAAIGACVAILIHFIFGWCPLLVERIMNGSDMPLPERYSRLAANGSAGFVAAADLHSDALLWLRRDLLTRSTVGHVDIPRLEQGNVRLQVFAIVVAVPRGMNFLSNARPKTLDQDLVVPKMILERWPLSSYRSHLKRALVQCERLNRLAAGSDRRLSVTSSASQLENASLSHQKERASAVHAILALEGASALEHDVANVDTLFNAGLRVLGPAHFYDTEGEPSLNNFAVHHGMDLNCSRSHAVTELTSIMFVMDLI